jgi:serine/threonine-protein kinase
MGRVYEGHHVDIGRRVAIKILHSSYRHSEEVVERFRREARAASKIGHANIVDVTDSGITPDGAFYFVMEYLDGVDLEHLIQREGPLPASRALLIAAQICRALQAAHDAEIVHRDLKPANVMLVNRKDEDDFVKVLDFGISRNLDLEGVTGRRAGLTRPDVAVGTPTYMSPEQAAGMPADALTDVYAVGGLLYEMLTGNPPCEGEDVITVLNKKATEDPPPISRLRPDLPVEVQRLVMRALARNAPDRQPSMAALKEEVLGCLALSPGSFAPPPAAARAVTPAPAPGTQKLIAFRPRPWMLAAGSMGLLLLTAVASFVRHSNRGDESATAAAATPTELPVLAEAKAMEPPPAPAGQPVAEADMPRALARLPPTAAPPTLPVATTVHGDPAGRVPAALRMRLPGPKSQAAQATPVPRPPAFAAPVSAPPAPTTPAPTGDKLLPLERTPSTTPVYEETIRRGQTAFNEGNYAEAVRRAREAVSGGQAVAGHLLLGDAYYHLQRYADAVREYQSVLALEPANALARRGRELAERAAAAN